MARIKGTPKSESLYGTPYSDIIFGRSGNDTLKGRDGNDVLIGGRGNDRMYGGDGNDLIFGGLGNDRAYGGSGNDRLRGEEGRDYLDGGSGNDDLEGGDGDDELLGGAGNDRIAGGDGNDRAEGGDGDDAMIGGSHADSLEGGAGNDRLYGQGGNDILGGGLGNDLLDGAYGNDTLFGDEGNDTLKGQAGDDYLDGFEGDDKLFGGEGNDLMFGVAGADSLYGEGGDDIMSVGSLEVRAVDGGAGLDLVDLSMLSVDFTGPDGDLFRNIEKIDIGGGNTNLLTFDAQSVIDASGGAPGFPDNTLLVKGDGADAVTLEGSWTKGATLTDPFGETGKYVVYTSGAAQLLIESEIAVAPAGSAAIFDLASLDGSNGFTLVGVDEKDRSGFSVSSAGDVNGDGYVDVIVGAPAANGSMGESYLVFGKADWSGTPSIDLATLDGANGVRLTSSDAGAEADYSGFSVSSAGDINGDGFADLIIGAPGFIGEYGNGPYVVFGKADWTATPSIDLVTLDGTNGFHLIGSDGYDVAGRSVSSAGDVNGDGFADLFVGAPRAGIDPYGSGGSYVVFGKADWSGSPSLDLAALDGSDGFRLGSVSGVSFNGATVSTAGDVNGDGFADLVVGANDVVPGSEPYGGGEAYIVFGKADWSGTPSFDLEGLDGTNGFKVFGTEPFQGVGRSVDGGGDLNGDGFADVIVDNAVIFGKADWTGAPAIDPSALDGSNGFIFTGAGAGPAHNAGDVNGDGLDDVILNGAYVVYGKADWSSTPAFDVTTLDATTGFRIVGIEGGNFPRPPVSAADDVNGDGFGDLVIGAPLAEGPGGATDEGESYVVFGGNFSGAVAHLGGSGADALSGDASAESFVGGGGDDILTGNGGADSFQGGSGDDVMRVASLDFLVVDGGTGTDTLALDGGGLDLDLTALADSRTRSIERIDVTGSGDNSLTLSVLDVLNLSDLSDELLVAGDAGDTVDQGAGWTAAASGGGNGNGTSTIDGQTYQIYTAGQATLLVDTDMIVTS